MESEKHGTPRDSPSNSHQHQTRTEASIGNLGARAAAVEVDLVVRPLFAYLRGSRKVVRIVSSQLPKEENVFELHSSHKREELLTSIEDFVFYTTLVPEPPLGRQQSDVQDIATDYPAGATKLSLLSFPCRAWIADSVGGKGTLREVQTRG